MNDISSIVPYANYLDDRDSFPERRLWVNLVLPQVILLPPLISYLSYHVYSPFKPEALSLIAIVMGLGAIVSLPLTFGSPRLQVGSAAFVVVLFADIQMNWGVELPHLLGAAWMPVPMGVAIAGVLVLIYAVVMLVFWSFRKHLFTVLLVLFSTVFVSAVLLPSPTVLRGEAAKGTAKGTAKGARNANLPPIVHLLLDEHIGLGGLPRDVPTAQSLKYRMRSLYLNNGFRLFERVYSRFFFTEISLKDMFSFTEPRTDVSSYFDSVAKLGYRIRIHQTDHVDFCSDTGFDLCHTYPVQSIHLLQEADAPFVQKFTVIYGRYFSQSFTYFGLKRTYNKEIARRLGLPEWRFARESLSPIPAMVLFERVIKEVAEIQRGTLIFAHVLLPHNPYAYAADCTLLPVGRPWLQNCDPDLPLPLCNTVASRALRYEGYLDQLDCANKKLEELFDGMKRAGVWDEAILIVHGDHGSRIVRNYPETANTKNLEDDDFIDSFSTHFAFKIGGVKAGIDNRFVSLRALFKELRGGTPENYPQNVFLPDTGNPGTFQPALMPPPKQVGRAGQ